MTAPINTDPPQPIEPTRESVPDPISSSNMTVHAMDVTPEGVPSGDFISLSDVPLSLLLEMLSSGNEAAAREIAWRMDNDADADGDTAATTDEEPA